jgi:hypothetical protein
VAESQQNAYQAALTKAIGNISGDDEEKNALRQDNYSEAADEAVQSWISFRNRAADLIKLAADSNEDSSKVSGLFGLKAFTPDDEKNFVNDYSEKESQYNAMLATQKNAIEAQQQYDRVESSLLAKRVEYNNAISGAE